MTGRVVTLTPNPSLDRTLEVDGLVRGAVLRAVGTRLDPGGKGVNVSRALAAHGLPTTAVLPSGGPEGVQLTELLAPRGVEVSVVKINGTVRVNISVVEPDGTVTKLNEPGPELTADEVDRLIDTSLDAAEGATWLVGCGSLPLGAPDDLYARVAARLDGGPTRFGVDSSGPALAAAVAAGVDLVKPNLAELSEVVGRPLARLGDVVEAATELRARGVGTVLASLGADGALLATPDGVWHGRAFIDVPRSSVGAGDALFAGYLSATDLPPAEALRTALAWGGAAAALPGSRMPAPSDVAAIRVVVHDRIDPARTLIQEPS